MQFCFAHLDEARQSRKPVCACRRPPLPVAARVAHARLASPCACSAELVERLRLPSPLSPEIACAFSAIRAAPP
eukprot:1858807-Pleurochrysis_carterae.AAC.1